MITIKDIAILAGVNISTVSRALNNSTRISDEQKKNIKQIATKLGYRPDELAKSLRKKSMNFFGIVVPDISNSFYSEIVNALESVLSVEKYFILLGQSLYNDDNLLHYVDIFCRYRVLGMFVVSHKQLPAMKKIVEDASVPVVFIDAADNALLFPTLQVDNSSGVNAAIEHLVALGHRKIGFFASSVTSFERVNAYYEAIQNLGLEYNEKWILIDNEHDEKSGYEKAMKLLQNGDMPTALFCANDVIMIGAMKAFKDIGLHIPEDISLVGFDGLETVFYLDPPLTTIKQPKGEMGKKAAGIMLDMIQPDRKISESNIILNRPYKISLNPELIIGKSTTSPRYKQL